MTSHTTDGFRQRLAALPIEVQSTAQKQFRRFLEDPTHPSLQFKRVGTGLWSVRVSLQYRALARRTSDADLHWCWIGSHAEYDRLTN